MKKQDKRGEVCASYEIAIFGIILLILGTFGMFWCFGGIDNYLEEIGKPGIVIECWIILLSAWLISLPFTFSLKYDEEGITVKRLFRKERHYRYDELGQVLPWFSRGGPSFDICRKDGKKIANLASGYCGVYEFLMVLEEKGLAPGASDIFNDDKERDLADNINTETIPIYNEENNFQNNDYCRTEIPVVNGVFTDGGDNYLGIFVDNVHPNNKEQIYSDVVLYDIKNQKIINRFGKVNSTLLFSEYDEYDHWHYSHGLSDKGAYFFSEAVNDHNIKSSNDDIETDVIIHIYDKSTFSFIDSFRIFDFIKKEFKKELYCNCWEKEFAVLDAIKIGDDDVYVAFGDRFGRFPFFSVIKYNIITREFKKVGYADLRETFEDSKLHFFDFKFVFADELLKIQIKVAPKRLRPWEKELPDRWITNDYYIVLQKNKLKDAKCDPYLFDFKEVEDHISVTEEIYLFSRKKDDMYIATDKCTGKELVKICLGRYYVFYSSATPDLNIIVHTHGKEIEDKVKSTTTYVLYKENYGYALVDKIKTDIPYYRIVTDCNAFILEEKTRTIILR